MRLSISGVINNCSETKSFVKGQDVCVGVRPLWYINLGYVLHLAWHALNPAWRRHARCWLAGASRRRWEALRPQIPPPPQSFPQPQTHYIHKYSINPSPTCLKSWTWLNHSVRMCLFESLSMLIHHPWTNGIVFLPGFLLIHLFALLLLVSAVEKM